MSHGIQEANASEPSRGYFIPATLMNKLIASIFGVIIAVGAYMIIWAVNDAAWKGIQEQRLIAIEKDLDKLPPVWLQDDVRTLQEDLREHLNNHEP